MLVGDQTWAPTRDDWFMSPSSGELEYGRCIPGLTVGLARWWWNPTSRELQSLPPLRD
jgi:hypothetical protein